MQKTIDFLVKKRNILFGIFIVLAVVCIVLMSRVNIITDMTTYLPDDSSMKKGIDIMAEEFSGLTSSNTIKLMFIDLEDSDKLKMAEKLSEIEYVSGVTYESDSDTYNKGNKTLYLINSEYGFYSAEMAKIERSLKQLLKDGYTYEYIFDTNTVDGLPIWIIVLAVALVMGVLFLMCSSWIEPILFLFTIGVAVVINMGTNCFLPGVSNTTYSIAAILQLVLSMDYSIMLINRYRQEQEKSPDKEEAMKQAITGAISSIASSALTTIVGLLALIFMSFKIGADMGIVLAKGVCISFICIMTVLPALILMCDRLIIKTSKKVIYIPVNGLANYSFRGRFVITAVFIGMITAVFLWKGNAEFAYTMEKTDEVSKVFPSANTFVLLYNNNDEEAIGELEAQLADEKNRQEADEQKIDSISAYATTIGKQYTAAEFLSMIQSSGMMDSSAFSLDDSMIRFIYYGYYNNKMLDGTLTVEEFFSFLQNDIIEKEAFGNRIDDEIKESISRFAPFCSKEGVTKARTSEELAGLFDINKTMITAMMQASKTDEMSIADIMEFVSANKQLLEMVSQGNEMFDGQQLETFQMLTDAILEGKEYSCDEMAEMISGLLMDFDSSKINVTDQKIDMRDMIKLVYMLYFSQRDSDESYTMSIEQVFSYLVEDNIFGTLLDEETQKTLVSAANALENGKKQLIGEKHSICMITTYYADGSKEADEFMQMLLDFCNENLTEDYYIIGNTPMQYEMSQTFNDELNKITVITAAAIFVVVLVSFRSLFIPILLILLIQGSVYTTMVIMVIMGASMYYLALLIVQSILMGATIDYAILYTNYYREARKSISILEALKKAYHGAIHTILTSGLIMVLATWILGYAFEDPAIGQICHIIAIGATCALVMILLLLPGMLAAFDKFICHDIRGKRSCF